MEYFNRPLRAGILCTADNAGTVEASVYAAPVMTDERTVIIGLKKHRTLANLQENPSAVFLIVDPGETLADWRGARVYLKVRELALGGPALAEMRKEIARMNGDAAANLVDAAAKFEVIRTSPLIDTGRLWEQSL